MKKENNTSKQNELNWMQKNGVILLLIAGMILVLLCTSVQTVVLSGVDEDTGDRYNITLKYSVIGLCIKALPDENSQKINADHILFLNSVDSSVETAGEWLTENKCDRVEIFTTGYMQDQDELNDKLCKLLEDRGIAAKKGETK